MLKIQRFYNVVNKRNNLNLLFLQKGLFVVVVICMSSLYIQHCMDLQLAVDPYKSMEAKHGSHGLTYKTQ